MAEEAVTNSLKKKKLKMGAEKNDHCCFSLFLFFCHPIAVPCLKKDKREERKEKKRKKHNAIAYSILLNSFLFSTIRVRYVLRNTFWQRPERRKTEVRQTGEGTNTGQAERERDLNSKILTRKDSSVKSIWTYLVQSFLYCKHK